MFDFRNGMLGVVIVTLALAGSIFGAYFAGIESVEHEVVKYNELADVTGLFETEQTPQYIDFDPSTNYVGYYSKESYSVEMDQYYFAESEVGYTPNQRDNGTPIVNNYKINLEPSDYQDGIATLTNVETLHFTVSYRDYNPDTDSTFNKVVEADTTVITVRDMIDSLNLSSDIDWLQLSSIDGLNDIVNVDGEETEVNWCIFFPDSIVKTSGSNKFVWFGSQAAIEHYNGAESTRPVKVNLSATIDLKTNTIQLFEDKDYTNPTGTYSLDNVKVTYGGSQGGPIQSPGIILGDEIDYLGLKRPPVQYLNPNNGVYLKEIKNEGD